MVESRRQAEIRAGEVDVKIAILGGTGKEGAGLGQRWALAGHEILIGSRDAGRAQAKARELNAVVGKEAASGMTNADAAQAGELIVIALPHDGLSQTLPPLKDACRGKVVVSTVVPLTFGGPRLFTPPPVGSAAEEARTHLGGDARMVAAFHHIAAHELAHLEQSIDCDLLLCGDDAAAKQLVAELGQSMGLRVLDVGPLSNAGPIEGITALLATINRRYKLKNSGIKITGL